MTPIVTKVGSSWPSLPSDDRDNGIFLFQEDLKCVWKNYRQLLPGKHLAAYAQLNWTNCLHHLEPGLQQVGAARIGQNTEGEARSVRRQHIADQLVAQVMV